jgi:DNA-binding NtrC family response regulator
MNKIVIVDDERIVRESLQHWFEEEGYITDTAENGIIALDKFSKGRYDIALIDMKMPGMTGLELLKKVKQIDEECVVILITAFASVPTAIQALKDGAFDYVTKPVDPDELSLIVKKALKISMQKKENKASKTHIESLSLPENLIGESPQMRKIIELIKTVSEADSSVFIIGESGTSKGLVAEAIHQNSKRKHFPFVSINCGTLTDELFESELFGHVKGAFTGADSRKKGKFEIVKGGTIFFDEIGCISKKMQAELLRIIETKKFNRVGGIEMIDSDFRLITASNYSLERLVDENKFRKDLYYRLNVINITIPPLRERKQDIPILANFFLKKYSKLMGKELVQISNAGMDFLLGYDFPGNVKELEFAVERAILDSVGTEISVEDLKKYKY